MKLLLAALLLAICSAAPATAEGPWLTDMQQARALSKATGRPILAVFVGSDWCPQCFAMEKKTFDSKAFTNFANANLILVEVDLPRHKQLPKALRQQNENLAFKYDVVAFPTSVLLDGNGKRITTVRGAVFEPTDYLNRLQAHMLLPASNSSR